MHSARAPDHCRHPRRPTLSSSSSVALEGGANGATFPGKTVRQGGNKGKYFHGFTKILVNKTSGEVLTEEEQSHASMNREKKAKTK